MNKNETEKFNQTISEGFQELIKNRPEKPLEHFIFFLMSTLPEETQKKDKNLLAFFKKYDDSQKSEANLSPTKLTSEMTEKSINSYGDFGNISD